MASEFETKIQTIKIAVVLPCYKSSKQVLNVLNAIPDFVDAVYCIDDACPENTGKIITDTTSDDRITVITHNKNQGVGGAMITGYKAAMADDCKIIVKIDSDGQMDPALIPSFIAPIVREQADYTKGNRFYSPEFLSGMPLIRIIGNAGLSFLNKFSTGYWQIFDPTNGYTAIHANILKLLPLDKLNKRYFFESDMLFRLGTMRALVSDVPLQSTYAEEESNLVVSAAFFTFAANHIKNFFKRIAYCYFVRDFHVASLEWVLGPAMFFFSLIYGINAWIHGADDDLPASAGTVMLAALPFITGIQLMLSALHFDIQNQPAKPLFPFIKK